MSYYLIPTIIALSVFAFVFLLGEWLCRESLARRRFSRFKSFFPIEDNNMEQNVEDLNAAIELATERHWLAGLNLEKAKSTAREEVLASGAALSAS